MNDGFTVYPSALAQKAQSFDDLHVQAMRIYHALVAAGVLGVNFGDDTIGQNASAQYLPGANNVLEQLQRVGLASRGSADGISQQAKNYVDSTLEILDKLR